MVRVGHEDVPLTLPSPQMGRGQHGVVEPRLFSDSDLEAPRSPFPSSPSNETANPVRSIATEERSIRTVQGIA